MRSGPMTEVPASISACRPETRISKNSSRLLETMHRNRSRSSSGAARFSACASTRRLNASCPISRFKNSSGMSRGLFMASRRCGRPAPAARRGPAPRVRQSDVVRRLLFAGRRDVAGSDVRPPAEKMLLHLLREVVARLLVGEVEAVLIDQHLLLFEPLFPGLLRDLLENALPQSAGIRRKIKAFRLAPELHALHHSRHGRISALPLEYDRNVAILLREP